MKEYRAYNTGAGTAVDNDLISRANLPDNENIRKLPNHLRQFIVDQNYKRYTPVDHAVWRYVMRQNYNFLREYAHLIYFEGLEKTGIGVERIPSILEMNEILARIGWAAVTVDGFIPPSAFMEFQEYRVLVIAADIRQIEHVEYTPAPDIIHEAAGHAPIIADQQYADYLQQFGAVGAKALSSKKDFELYEAIRHLSILKEAHTSDPAEIKQAEADVTFKQANLGKPSEMALVSRLHWWTVEYGLIGTLEKPKIYGAGLLSSIGESANCIKPSVKKIAYTIDAANYAFDITTQQPQLFVTPSFEHLSSVLADFASRMAYKVGGLESVKKAIDCANTCTCQYSSGLQVSGTFTEVLLDDRGELAYIKTGSPTNLAFEIKELPGHDKNYHRDGFGSPVGKLRHHPIALEDCSDGELERLGIVVARKAELIFESGVAVNGRVESVLRRNNKVLLITFTDCRVTFNGSTLFDPAWGKYDMAVGAKISSVFSGAADKDAFDQVPIVPKERTIKVTYDKQRLALHELYQQVRDCRERRSGFEILPGIWQRLRADHGSDWLLSMEILEVLAAEKLYPTTAQEIRAFLESRAREDESLTKMIADGFHQIDKQG
ncbi:MAG: aromatic amino acid hydroxylase [Candidatus Zixiibacteriota bacterium]